MRNIREKFDPIERVRTLLKDNGLAYAHELNEIQKSIKREIDEAIEESKMAPQPPREWLQANIYKDPTNAVMRGATAECYLNATSIPYDKLNT